MFLDQFSLGIIELGKECKEVYIPNGGPCVKIRQDIVLVYLNL